MKSITKKIVVFSMVGMMQFGFGAALTEASPSHDDSRWYEHHDQKYHEKMVRERQHLERMEMERHEREMRRYRFESSWHWRERQRIENERHEREMERIAIDIVRLIID